MHTAQKVDLKDFLEVVKKERSYGMYVTGLVIRKSSDAPTIEDIARTAHNAVTVTIARNTADGDILTKFRGAFENHTWLVIHLSDGSLPPLWREQLSRLRDSNSIFVQGRTASETFFAEQSADTRVIAVIDEQYVDVVEYPLFLSLFGPVAEL